VKVVRGGCGVVDVEWWMWRWGAEDVGGVLASGRCGGGGVAESRVAGP
jgi:hypothetical protein